MVSSVHLSRPIVGYNVIQELILGHDTSVEVVATIASLLKEAIQIEGD